jgi:hypothetical protein
MPNILDFGSTLRWMGMLYTPTALSPGKRARYQLDNRRDWSQNQYGWHEEQRNAARNETRTATPRFSSLYSVAILRSYPDSRMYFSSNKIDILIWLQDLGSLGSACIYYRSVLYLQMGMRNWSGVRSRPNSVRYVTIIIQVIIPEFTINNFYLCRYICQ